MHLQVCLQTPNSFPGRPQTTGTRHKNCYNNPTTPTNQPQHLQIQPTTPQPTPGYHPSRTITPCPKGPLHPSHKHLKNIMMHRGDICAHSQKVARSRLRASNYKNPEREQVPTSTKNNLTFQQVLIITRRKIKISKNMSNRSTRPKNRKHDAISIIQLQ